MHTARLLVVARAPQARDAFATRLQALGYTVSTSGFGEALSEGLAADALGLVLFAFVGVPDLKDELARIEAASPTTQAPVLVALPTLDAGAMAACLDGGAVGFFIEHAGDDELNAQIQFGLVRGQARRRLAALESLVAGGVDTDPLTSLLNASGFRRRLAVELKRIPRFKIPFSYALFACEGLEQISEAHGAAAADEIRVEVARLLVASLRDTDLIARVQPDGFAVGLPGAPLTFGLRTIQRLCDLVALNPFFADGHLVEVKVRSGLTTSSPTDLRTADAMLAEAERALLCARETGVDVTSVPPDLSA